jgi:hypothetical protein
LTPEDPSSGQTDEDENTSLPKDCSGEVAERALGNNTAFSEEKMAVEVVTQKRAKLTKTWVIRETAW